MARPKELESCLMYAKKLKELQSEKKEHQEDIVDFTYELERCIKKIKICNYVIWGILGFVGFIFILFMKSNEKTGFGELLSLALVSLIALVITMFVKRNIKRELAQGEDGKKAFIKLHNDAIEEIEEQLSDLMEEMLDKNLFDVIPTSYFYPSAIEYIISVFNRRLADDMKEAFKLLEAEIQRTQAMKRQSEFNESLIHEVQQLTEAVNLNTYITSKKE